MQSCKEAYWANCGVIWHLLTSENVLATIERERERDGGRGWCCNEPCLISKWGTCRWPSWVRTPLKWEQKHRSSYRTEYYICGLCHQLSCVQSALISGACVMIFSLKTWSDVLLKLMSFVPGWPIKHTHTHTLTNIYMLLIFSAFICVCTVMRTSVK